MSGLQWMPVGEKPTEEGWYWLTRKTPRITTQVVELWKQYDGVWIVSTTERNASQRLDHRVDCRFAGPLVPPVEG